MTTPKSTLIADLERENAALRHDAEFQKQYAEAGDKKLAEERARNAELLAALAFERVTVTELRRRVYEIQQVELPAEIRRNAELLAALEGAERDFVGISEYWNGGNESAIDACLHNADVAEGAAEKARLAIAKVKIREHAPHPDTERLDWLSDEWSKGNVSLNDAAVADCQTLRGAIDAARKEVSRG